MGDTCPFGRESGHDPGRKRLEKFLGDVDVARGGERVPSGEEQSTGGELVEELAVGDRTVFCCRFDMGILLLFLLWK